MLSLKVREARAVAAAIVDETEAIAATLSAVEDPFARRVPQEWSPAEHMEHLAFFTLYHLGHHHALIHRETRAS